MTDDDQILVWLLTGSALLSISLVSQAPIPIRLARLPTVCLRIFINNKFSIEHIEVIRRITYIANIMLKVDLVFFLPPKEHIALC